MTRCIKNVSTFSQPFLQRRFITSIEAFAISSDNKNIGLTDKTNLIRKQINSKISYTSSRGLYGTSFPINEYRLSSDDILELKRNLEDDGFGVSHHHRKNPNLSVSWSRSNDTFTNAIIAGIFGTLVVGGIIAGCAKLATISSL